MNKANFKEELTLEAEQIASNIDISEDMKRIKEKMKEYVECRKYTVLLIKPHDTMAVGGGCSNITQLFIPPFVSPLHYRQLFVEEFKKLGFTDDDMQLYVKETTYSDCYYIELEW